jgi:hypothetical protein
MTVLPQLERELLAAHRRANRRRRRLGWIAPAVAIGATIAVATVFVIALRHGGSTPNATGTEPGGTAVLRATPVNPHASLNAGVGTALGILQHRFGAAMPTVHVSRVGDQIVLRDVTAANRARALALAQPGRLALLDWEANVLLPSGGTVASGLAHQDPAALRISQGSGTGTAGQGGGLTLFDAVKLASRQPAKTYPLMSRVGSQLYLFGRPHSRICRAAGRAAPTPSGSCYVAGPAPSLDALMRGLPLGTDAGEILTVPSGTVILQAADASPGHQVAFDNPAARFFVLRDNAAIGSRQITHPAATTDLAGSPDVTFQFDRAGTAAFHRMTAAIAHRGALVSSAGLLLNQHFGIAVDGQLLSVPQIDFKQYPSGINGSAADVTGGFSATAARDLAAILRYGPLPVMLSSP